jgi:hypothetical protein
MLRNHGFTEYACYELAIKHSGDSLTERVMLPPIKLTLSANVKTAMQNEA